MAHELVEAFADASLPLHRTLVEMLDEHFVHRSERRGCGFAQATRLLAGFINRRRDPLDPQELGLFANWPLRDVELLAELAREHGCADGWRAYWRGAVPSVDVGNPRLEAARARLAALPSQMRQVELALLRQESRLLMAMVRGLVMGSAGPSTAAVMAVKPSVGSCPQAEEFFLEIAHGRVRRGGAVNVIVDDDGSPLLLEKVRLGNSHSALTIAPLVLNGVPLPAGSLCAVGHAATLQAPWARTPHGHRVPIGDIDCLHLLRLSTLCVAPEHRRRAFTVLVDAQIAAGLYSPLHTSIEQLRQLARDELGAMTQARDAGPVPAPSLPTRAARLSAPLAQSR